MRATARKSTALTVDGRWSIYILNGYSKDQAARRRSAGAAIGVYRAATVLAPRVHNAHIRVGADDTTRAEVVDIANLWTGEMDIWQVALFGIGVAVPLALDVNLDLSSIDDFLRVGVDWDLPGVGGDIDLSGQWDIPQG